MISIIRSPKSLAGGSLISEELDSQGKQRNLGGFASDTLALFGGSWTFLILFAACMAFWIILNVKV